jgi:hypothetical protein
MADSDEFTAVVRVLERHGKLNELQARGLVRRLLNQAGLRSSDVTAHQLATVGRTLLAESLRKNGVADSGLVVTQWLDCCAKQSERAKTSERGRVTNTVEEVFSRMGLKR